MVFWTKYLVDYLYGCIWIFIERIYSIYNELYIISWTCLFADKEHDNFAFMRSVNLDEKYLIYIYADPLVYLLNVFSSSIIFSSF